MRGESGYLAIVGIFSYSYLFQQQESARGRNEGGIGVHMPVGEPAPERWEARRSDSTPVALALI